MLRNPLRDRPLQRRARLKPLKSTVVDSTQKSRATNPAVQPQRKMGKLIPTTACPIAHCLRIYPAVTQSEIIEDSAQRCKKAGQLTPGFSAVRRPARPLTLRRSEPSAGIATLDERLSDDEPLEPWPADGRGFQRIVRSVKSHLPACLLLLLLHQQWGHVSPLGNPPMNSDVYYRKLFSISGQGHLNEVGMKPASKFLPGSYSLKIRDWNSACGCY
jgi:hypothetical protein